ncbi:MAG TPA: sulfatase [Thermoanaerobaculia bacterium]|nr:sulfatase [Thermoanaerobaculia bacterium]
MPRAEAIELFAVFAILAASSCRPAGERRVEPLPARSNILLITVDTLRADHLSSYGYGRATSPAIDRLAAEGVRFDETAVQWPKTTPSFASMFTATYSKDNNIVRRVGIPISCRFETLAKALKRLGYSTQAVVSNGALGSEFYFDQGFDTYVETWKLQGAARGSDPTRAEAVTRLAVGLLDKLAKSQADGAPASAGSPGRSRRPYFLWVHYLDPHFPYASPAPWRDRFQGDKHFDASPKINISPDRPRQQMGGIGSEHVLERHEELAFYVARYDAAIAYTDAQIGNLLAEMRRRDLLRHTLTVFTSDHGESLGEHLYYFDHGRFGFQTCLRVPLIFHYPGVLAPRIDRRPVELVDLAPTLLETGGLALPGGMWKQGRSLTPRLRGIAPQGESRAAALADAAMHGGGAVAASAGAGNGALASRAAGAQSSAAEADSPDMAAVPADASGAPAGHAGLAFSEAGWETNNKWQKIVRDGRFKLVFAQTRPEQRWIGGEGVRFTLYDLRDDPGETRNVVTQFPDDFKRLKRALWSWDKARRYPVEVDQASTCGPGREMDSETRTLLTSLGYINQGPGSAAASDDDSPPP